MSEATSIKLKADCALERAIDTLEDRVTEVAQAEFHCHPEGEIEAAIDTCDQARAHLLEVIHGLIEAGIRSTPGDWPKAINGIMGCEQ